MFLSIWLHFKKCFGKYFLMFGCIFENTIEKTFSTCYSYFLTFSQLPNEYIISFIPKNTNKTQKISHFLGEIVIEIGAISISEIAIAILWSAWSQSRSCDRRDRAMHRSQSRSTPIGAVPVITIAIDADRPLSLSLSVFCSRGFFLFVALSLFCVCYGNHLKVKRFCKIISESTSANFGQTEIIFRKIYFP